MRSITLNVYRRDEARLQTQIDVTNEHIDLIASSTQLANLSTGNTLYSHMAALEVTASGLTSRVSSVEANKAGKTEIVSVINQSAESLKISGSKISANGVESTNGNFKVSVDGNVEITGKVTATSGKIANWVIGDNWIYQQRDITEGSTVRRYQLILNAPASMTTNTNGIVFRSSTDWANNVWNDALIIKHDGTLMSKAFIDSTNKYKSVWIQNGRLKYLYGASGTTWIGEWAVGTYTETGYNDRNAIYLMAHQNNVVGFAIGNTSEGTGNPTLYYNSNHDVWVLNKHLWMQTHQIVNAGRISATEFYVNSGSASNSGFCVHGKTKQVNIGTTEDPKYVDAYYQMAWAANVTFFFLNGGQISSIVSSSSDRNLKENFKEIDDNLLLRISNVPIQQFNYTKDAGLGSETHFGAIAQDVKTAMNGVNSNIVYETPESGHLNINYIEFLILRLAALEKRVKELENERSRV